MEGPAWEEAAPVPGNMLPAPRGPAMEEPPPPLRMALPVFVEDEAAVWAVLVAWRRFVRVALGLPLMSVRMRSSHDVHITHYERSLQRIGDETWQTDDGTNRPGAPVFG